MKIKFLGTVAAEGMPALFCNCDLCKKAKELGGKNIRTRSQLLINDDMLVDFPPDTYMHKLKYDLDLSKVKYLLITHSHHDHFDPYDIGERHELGAHKKLVPTIKIYGDARVKRLLLANSNVRNHKEFNIKVLKPFTYVKEENYEFYSLKANHAKGLEKPLMYLIKQDDKVFLQLFDTGPIDRKNYEYLEKLNIKVDAICLDATLGTRKRNTYYGHMSLEDVFYEVDKMRKSNFTKKETRYIITHFSHNDGLMHDEYEKICKPLGIEVAYDGFELDI